jgi:quercetin dioxygenase-like cupin family protein
MLMLPLLCQQAVAQDAFAFFRGETFPPARAQPAAWLHELHKADQLLNANVAVAEFLPNTKLAWHNHPGGQILLITDGVGYYQEKGKPKLIVRVGDVVKCDPGVQHWHGASVDSGVTYVAISPAQKGPTVWAEPVSDADFTAAAVDKRTRPKSKKAGAGELAEIHGGDAIFPFKVASVAFAPGKRLDWHKDPAGQIIIVTDGTGYYQERGKPKQVVRKGDVITSAPGLEHWHGAAAEIGNVQLVITPVSDTPTAWLQKVTDAEFTASPGKR